MTSKKRPGHYLGKRYLGQSKLPGRDKRATLIVGAVFDNGSPPRWMNAEEYAALPSHKRMPLSKIVIAAIARAVLRRLGPTGGYRG